MDLTSMLFNGAERYPEAAALLDGSTTLSYRELADRVLSTAAALRTHGVGKGDRIAIGMRNTADHVVTFFATQAAGAVAVPFNFRIKGDGIEHVVRDSDARLLVTDEAVREDTAREIAGRAGIQWIDERSGRPALRDFAQASSPEQLDVDPGGATDLSVILYTSGTTGRPKGVPLTHRNAYERVVSYVASAGPLFGSGMRTLGAAPLYHTVGLHWVLCLTVYLNGAYFPLTETSQQGMRDLIQDQELNFLFGSPTLFHMLLGEENATVYPSVQEVSFGSAPMDAGLLAQMQQAFPNATINEVYGTTETSIPFVTRDVTRWPTGALRITADHRVRIVDPLSDSDAELPPGQVGELLVDMRNEASFTGYWHAEERTAKAVRDGWYHTGDAFERDADGSYYIRGRLDDMFISGGENIQPLDVEKVLLSHPQVEDAAVIGTPDPRWGQVVTAFVTASGELDAHGLDAFCRGSALDDFKRPRRVFFLSAIPRNPSGKIVRAELRALYDEMSRG